MTNLSNLPVCESMQTNQAAAEQQQSSVRHTPSWSPHPPPLCPVCCTLTTLKRSQCSAAVTCCETQRGQQQQKQGLIRLTMSYIRHCCVDDVTQILACAYTPKAVHPHIPFPEHPFSSRCLDSLCGGSIKPTSSQDGAEEDLFVLWRMAARFGLC